MSYFDFYTEELTAEQRQELQCLMSIHEKAGMRPYDAAMQALRDKIAETDENRAEIESLISEAAISSIGVTSSVVGIISQTSRMLMERMGITITSRIVNMSAGKVRFATDDYTQKTLRLTSRDLPMVKQAIESPTEVLPSGTDKDKILLVYEKLDAKYLTMVEVALSDRSNEVTAVWKLNQANPDRRLLPYRQGRIAMIQAKLAPVVDIAVADEERSDTEEAGVVLEGTLNLDVEPIFEGADKVIMTLNGKELDGYSPELSLRKKAEKYYKEHFQGKSANNNKLKSPVRFSRKGLDEFIYFSSDTDKLKLIPSLKAVIEHGDYEGREEINHIRKDGIVAFHLISANVILSGAIKEVRVEVGEDRQGHLFYDLFPDRNAHDLKRKKPHQGEEPKSSFNAAHGQKVSLADNSNLPLSSDVVKPVFESAYNYKSEVEKATTFEDIQAVFDRLFLNDGETAINKGREYIDVGEKIGGAKKDIWAAILAGGKRLEREDLEGIDSGTASKLVKKDTVIQGIVESFETAGVEPGAGFIMHKVFSSYAAKPADTDIAREQYVVAADRITSYFRDVKSIDDFEKVLSAMRDEFNGFALTPEEKVIADDYQAKVDAWTLAKHDKWKSIVFDTKYRTAKGSFNRTKASIDYYDWQKKNKEQYLPLETSNNCNLLYQQWEKRENTNPQSKRNQYRALGDRFINILNNTSTAFNANLAEASNVSDWAWLTPEQKEKKERVKVIKPEWKRIIPENVELSGGADREFKPQDLIDIFKIRGVEYGNYVDEESARHHTKMLGLSFLDMSTILGIPTEQISYGGRLGIAFGARGVGGFAAHYEPDKKVINMTKMNGGGSLAHEWGHFLDNVVHLVSHNGEVKHSYASNSVSGGKTVQKQSVVALGEHTPPEMQQAFEALHAAMMIGDEGAKWSDIADNKKPIGSSYTVDPVLAASATPQQAMDSLRNKTSRKWSKAKQKYSEKPYYTEDDLRIYAGYIEAKTGVKVYYKQGVSKFYTASAQQGGDYWTRPHEMMARSFEMYISDKMSERGIRNSYLVSGLKGLSEDAPYPAGDEKVKTNAAFDKLFDVLKGHKILESALMLAEDEVALCEYGEWVSNFNAAMESDCILESTDEPWDLKPGAVGTLKGNIVTEINALGFNTKPSNVVASSYTARHINDSHGKQLNKNDETYLKLAIESPSEVLPNIALLNTKNREKSILLIHKANKDYIAIVEVRPGDKNNVLLNFWKMGSAKANTYLAKFRQEKTRLLQSGGATVIIPHIPMQAGEPEGLPGSQIEKAGLNESTLPPILSDVKSVFESAYKWQQAIADATTFEDITAVFDWLFPKKLALLDKPPIAITKVDNASFTNPDLKTAALDSLQALRASFALLPGGIVINNDSGISIASSNKMTNHAMHLKHPHIREHIEVAPFIPELLQKAVLAETYDDKKDGNPNLKIHMMYAPFVVKDKLFRVKMTVQELKKSTDKSDTWTRFYDHSLTELEEIKSPATESTDTTLESEAHSQHFTGLNGLSISDLLKGARKNDGTLFVPEDTNNLASKGITTDTNIDGKIIELKGNGRVARLRNSGIWQVYEKEELYDTAKDMGEAVEMLLESAGKYDWRSEIKKATTFDDIEAVFANLFPQKNKLS